ncbi:MAG: hypothetical protein ABI361_01590 [Nitrososphaera sp.]
MSNDPSPLPYGALDSYQLHFIVECNSDDNERLLAKCEPITKGRFGSKQVIDVRWTGSSSFADTLQNDAQLSAMLKEVLLFEGEIRVDPVGSLVRIYGKWHSEYDTHFSHTMAEIADRIAMHVRMVTGQISKAP